MDNQSLEYLAQRLEAVAKGDFVQAAILVRKVIASTSPRLRHPDAEHALYLAVWSHISTALDHQDYDLKDEEKVYALESEMAGCTLNHRIKRGWMSRSDSAPDTFPHIDDFFSETTMATNPNMNETTALEIDMTLTQPKVLSRPGFWDRDHPLLMWIILSTISSVVLAFFMLIMMT